MKSITQIISEIAQGTKVPPGFQYKPDMNLLRSALDTVRIHNPSAYSRVKQWVFTMSQLSTQYPNGVSAEDFIDFFELAGSGKDLRYVQSVLKLIFDPLVAHVLPAPVRTQLQKMDKFISQYYALNAAPKDDEPEPVSPKKIKTNFVPKSDLSSIPIDKPAKQGGPSKFSWNNFEP